MNKRYFLCSIMLLLLAVFASAKGRSIVVVYENDVHCAIDRYAAFAGFRDAIAAADTADVLTVSSGDFIQGGFAGAISKGEYIIDMMKAVGYDAVTLGNHEFDYGSEKTRSLMERLGAPVTCVNYTKAGSTEPVFLPYVMKRVGEKRVAFVGALTPGTIATESYAFDGYDTNESRTVEMVQKAVDDARREGADYVVVLAHLGEDVSQHTQVTSHSVAEATRGIDVVLDGHSHNAIPQFWTKNIDGDSVLISQTGSLFRNIGKLVLREGKRPFTELCNISKVTNVSQKVKATEDSIRQYITAKEREMIGHSDFTLVVSEGDRDIIRCRETNFGDFVTDAMRYVGKTDIAVCNAGGIRNSIVAGDITYKSVIDALPYSNDICTAEISGEMLLKALNNACAVLPVESGGFMQVSGMRYTVEGNKVVDVQIEREDADGNVTLEPLSPTGKYTITSSDYVLYLGRESEAFHNATIVNDKICPYSDPVITYLRDALGGVVPEKYNRPQDRIIIKK